MLDRERIVSQLNTDRYERGLILGDRVSSTNTQVKDMAEHGAAEGCTIIADTQTGGRGRRGRVFHSPEGGLYLSTLLRPAADTDPGLITCCAAVAAARAVESLCALSVDIKWVNDLYVHGRKVAGLLAEGVLTPAGGLTAVVLGVGVNVTNTLPAELADIATSLRAEGAAVEREDLAAAFLNEWERAYATLPTGDFMTEYRRRNLVPGRQVTVVQGERTYPATALAITDRGHLLVRSADGAERELVSGEVTLRL